MLNKLTVRRATTNDIDRLNTLLLQVLQVHHGKRPDLFRAGAKKYSDDELTVILQDEKRPVFVAVDDDDVVLGYAFCIHRQLMDDAILTPIHTLYIDDLCVDEAVRHQHIGSMLYDHVLAYAKEQGCYNVTLNVWADNTDAVRFYQTRGLHPQKIGMEVIL